MAELKFEDTIAAIATPLGVGGVSVIRISGEKAFEVTAEIFRPLKGTFPEFASHTAHFGHILDGKNEAVDQGIVTLFRKPHSYTGEDVAEIGLHGGLVVTKKVLGILIRRGARLAEPGEFTRRAFLNGKIDLTQAEAVLDLIRAKSEKSVEVAARQLAGALSAEFKRIKDEILKLYAHMEAYLDFPDEQLEIFGDGEFLDRFRKICGTVERLKSSFRRGSVLREGLTVAIAGKPNVGKSSLFNALLERDRAIVSEYPGTTRDTLEEAIEIEGVYVRLIDTAGLTPDLDHPLDQMSMQKTREAIRKAEICLWIVDGTSELSDADRAVFAEIGDSRKILALINKSDLPAKLGPDELRAAFGTGDPVKISVKTREGIDQLEAKIAEIISREIPSAEGEQVTRLRHLRALEEASVLLGKAEAGFLARQSLEYVTCDLKAALERMSELLGEVYSEDLLDVIFSEFCIGK
jgi:tRNA modification GTPase